MSHFCPVLRSNYEEYESVNISETRCCPDLILVMREFNIPTDLEGTCCVKPLPLCSKQTLSSQGGVAFHLHNGFPFVPPVVPINCLRISDLCDLVYLTHQ